jgi:hypothetical protein
VRPVLENRTQEEECRGTLSDRNSNFNELRDVDGQRVPRVAERQAPRKKNLKNNTIALNISATNATKTGIVRAAL